MLRCVLMGCASCHPSEMRTLRSRSEEIDAEIKELKKAASQSHARTADLHRQLADRASALEALQQKRQDVLEAASMDQARA